MSALFVSVSLSLSVSVCLYICAHIYVYDVCLCLHVHRYGGVCIVSSCPQLAGNRVKGGSLLVPPHCS